MSKKVIKYKLLLVKIKVNPAKLSLRFLKKDRVIVEGINMVKKHTKPSNINPQGGILNVEAPIHVSNVMLIDPKTGEPTRVNYQVKDGKKSTRS